MERKSVILIVDDSKTNRAVLNGIFKEKYEILEARDGLEALEVLKKRQDIALMLLDLNMPRMDGFQLLEFMQKSISLTRIPVVVNTQLDDKDNELRALQLGAIDFIQKPYNNEIVMHRVQNVIVKTEYERQKIREEMNEKQISTLRYHLEHDPLTGIYVREKFCEETKKMLFSNIEERYVLLRWDIERFKVINDQFGSEIGDSILKEIASILKKYLHGIGTYGRLKADNFVCCYPMKMIKPEKLMECLENSFSALHLNYKISLYMGIYEVKDITIQVDQMCDRANLAINQIKGSSITYQATYDEILRGNMLEEQEMVSEMRQALAEEQFCIYLQPVYDVITNKPVSAEALVRWIHPRKGMISPGKFIPLFERNGFITMLDAYVWEETCKFLKENREKGIRSIPVSVNVSRMNLYDTKLVDKFIKLVDKYGIERENLHLEITESAYVDNPRKLLESMKSLQGAGFKILTDDFGSGYSSLNMIKDVPSDILKLDMEFIRGIGVSKRAESVIHSVIHMAKGLQMGLIAEGVETLEQLNFLRSKECENVQGFYYSKPLPINEFNKLIEAG